MTPTKTQLHATLAIGFRVFQAKSVTMKEFECLNSLTRPILVLNDL